MLCRESMAGPRGTGYPGYYEYSVKCMLCGATAPTGVEYDIGQTPEEAEARVIEAWNRRGRAEVNVMDKPNTVRGVFEVRASAEFYDDEATVETLRNYIEQLFEDAELDAGVKVLRKQMPLEPVQEMISDAIFWRCGQCGALVTDIYCPHCGRKVNWDA